MEMQRIVVKKIVDRKEKIDRVVECNTKSEDYRQIERKLIKLLPINQSGMIVYPGKNSQDLRTGSAARTLIQWFLYKCGDQKPIDEGIFSDYLKKEFGITRTADGKIQTSDVFEKMN